MKKFFLIFTFVLTQAANAYIYRVTEPKLSNGYYSFMVSVTSYPADWGAAYTKAVSQCAKVSQVVDDSKTRVYLFYGIDGYHIVFTCKKSSVSSSSTTSTSTSTSTSSNTSSSTSSSTSTSTSGSGSGGGSYSNWGGSGIIQ